MDGTNAIEMGNSGGPGGWKPNWNKWMNLAFFFLGIIVFVLCAYQDLALAGVQLPGSDVSGQLEAMGDLIRILDTALFKWASRLIAGLLLLTAGMALKNQQFGSCMLCVVGAFIVSTIPKWVRNLFLIGGGDSVFSYLENIQNYFV